MNSTNRLGGSRSLTCGSATASYSGPNRQKPSVRTWSAAASHRIQEKAYGGLPSPVKRQLDPMGRAASAKPAGQLELPQRIKPGSELVRTWTYRVTVVADGFANTGKTFSSLSEIAFAITGTKWNGPRFFGMRSAHQEVPDGK